MSINIRKAETKDLPSIYALVKELALYEQAPHEPSITVEEFVQDGSGDTPRFQAILAEKNGQTIGGAVYYHGYSTWKGKIIYLDDIVVNESYRKQGIGTLLFKKLLQITQELQVNQLRWHVLDWNHPAIKFYKKINASLDEHWITCKIEKDGLYIN